MKKLFMFVVLMLGIVGFVGCSAEDTPATDDVDNVVEELENDIEELDAAVDELDAAVDELDNAVEFTE